MRVSEVMSTPVWTIGAERSAADAWEAMQLHRTRHLVVTAGDGHAVGVVSASDLGGKYGHTLRNLRQVAELMTEKIVAATPATTVREAANLMRGHRVGCLPVFVGPHLKGMVTALDLLDLIGRGAERPVARSERRVMKDRGQRPAMERAAKRLASPRKTVVR
jgi:acetoin utilization protein AcuB